MARINHLDLQLALLLSLLDTKDISLYTPFILEPPNSDALFITKY